MNELLILLIQNAGFLHRKFTFDFDSFFQGGKCTEIFIIFAPVKNILDHWSLGVKNN